MASRYVADLAPLGAAATANWPKSRRLVGHVLSLISCCARRDAVRAGHLLSWWPSSLLRIVTERALAGTLDEETVVALDKCAYAELTPIQANPARKLLDDNEALLDTAAQRLVGLGEPEAAARLREGDIGAVAFAARLSTL